MYQVSRASVPAFAAAWVAEARIQSAATVKEVDYKRTPVLEVDDVTFLVIAKDGTDPDAPARRQRVRERHLEEIKPAVAGGTVQLGGAILDEAGEMIGSALLLEAESEEAARAFLEADIYSKAGVWQDFEIYPFRRAV